MAKLLTSVPTPSQPQQFVIVIGYQHTTSLSTSHNHLILHLDFLTQDPSFPNDDPFSPTFHYPFCMTYGTHCICSFSLPELAAAYSIPPPMVQLFHNNANNSI